MRGREGWCGACGNSEGEDGGGLRDRLWVLAVACGVIDVGMTDVQDTCRRGGGEAVSLREWAEFMCYRTRLRTRLPRARWWNGLRLW